MSDDEPSPRITAVNVIVVAREVLRAGNTVRAVVVARETLEQPPPPDLQVRGFVREIVHADPLASLYVQGLVREVVTSQQSIVDMVVRGLVREIVLTEAIATPVATIQTAVTVIT